MALAALIEEQVFRAFEAIGDLRTSVDYHSVTVGTYDIRNAALNTTEVVTPNLLVALVGRKESENDFVDADLNTQKLLMPSRILPNLTPSADDYVMIAGQRWEVMRDRFVPGNGLYTMWIRLP